MTHHTIARAAACAVLAASLAACAKPAEKVDVAKVAETVKADVAQLNADFNAKDVEKAVGHDAPGYVGMFHGQPNVVGPAGDREITKMQVADPAVNLVVTTDAVDVSAAGDMAVARTTY